MTMMALGDFRFEINTAAYRRLERAATYRWEEQDRIGRQPAVQFVGSGLITINLEGTIYPTFRGGLGQIEEMRGIAAKGEPHLLIDGLGRVWGKWVIAEVRELQTVFTDDGRPRKIDFTLQIKQYGDD